MIIRLYVAMAKDGLLEGLAQQLKGYLTQNEDQDGSI